MSGEAVPLDLIPKELESGGMVPVDLIPKELQLGNIVPVDMLPSSLKQPAPQSVHTSRKGIKEPLSADMEAYKKAYEAGDEITYQPKPLDLTPSPNKNLAGVYAGQPPTKIPKLTLQGIKDAGVDAIKNTVGAGEVAANVLTGIPGFFVDAGIATGAGYGTLLRGGSIDEAAKNITGMQDLVRPYVVYQPKTDEAKKAADSLNKGLDFLIGTPTDIAGEYARSGVSAVAGKTSGAAAGAGIKTLTELAAYTVLFSGFTEGVKRLGGIKEPIKTRPLTDKDVIDFNNFIQEEAVRLKGKNLNTDDILEALRGREASQAAYDYIKILPTEERADLARSILKGKQTQVVSQTETAAVNKGGQLPVGGLEVKETEPVKTPPAPQVEANPQQVTLTPVTEPAFDITTSAGKMPVSPEWFDLKAMTDTVAEPERFDISMPAGEQAVDEGFDISTSGTGFQPMETGVGAYSNTPVPPAAVSKEKPRGFIPTGEIWDKTPMDVQGEWDDAVIYAEEIKQEALPKIQSLQEESRGLKGKENAQRKKDIHAEIEKLKQGYEGPFAGYENAAMDESLKMREAAIEKARAKGLVDEDKLEEFATEFLFESSTERPYIEYNYNKTIQQIFDEVIDRYQTPEGVTSQQYTGSSERREQLQVEPIKKEGKPDVDLEGGKSNIQRMAELAAKSPELEATNIKESVAEKAIQKGKKYYMDNLYGKKVFSPALNEDIKFSSRGLLYLRKKGTIEEQARRFKLLPKVLPIVENIKTIDPQDIRQIEPNHYRYSLLGRFKDGSVVRVVFDEVQMEGKKFYSVFDIEDLSGEKLYKKLGQSTSGALPSIPSDVTTPDKSITEAHDTIPSPEKSVKGEGETGTSGFTPDSEFRREATSETEATEPQKRSDIVNFLQEKLGLPLKVGRFRGGNKGVLGIFKVKQEVIRTKLANDIETISHEVGHALEKYLWPETRDKKGNLTGTAFKDFAGELNDIASQPRKGQPTEPEGFAEFVRLYITDEAKAIEKAPNFYNYFEKELQTRAPEVREILHKARADFNRWVNQPSMARVMAQISIGENKKPARNVDTLLKEAYTAVVDDLFPLRKIVKEMTGKEELPAAKDPYKLARLLRGWWGKAEAFLEYKPFDYNTYEWKGKSLKAILEPVKDNLDEFRAYIVSKRALELQARGIESGILPKDAKKIISDFDKKYSGTLSELIEYQDSLLRYLRDSGVIAPRDFARMKQANRDYVPFYRIFEGETAKGANKGMEAQDPIKRMKGSWRDIVDPLESIVKNTYLFINVAERNSVGRALVNLANSKEGMGKFVEKIPAPMRSVKVGVDEVLGKWAEKIDDPHIKEMLKDMNLSDETVSIFRPDAFVPKENVISVWEKGKRNLYEVDPDIARAFQALDKESMNSIVRLLSYPARWLRAGATLTPEFIARNPIRDQFSAFVYSKYGYVPIWDLTKGIFDVAKGNDIYWQWKKSGGEHSMLVSLDREYLQKNFEKVMQSKMEGLKDVIKNPIEALRIVSELAEAATRVGEFKRGVKKEGMTKAGMQEAGFSSREVTLDFARIGAKTKAVNSIIAFWNAQIQDTDRMIRAFKDRPWQTSFKVMAGITLPSVILAIVNHDDERWKEIPQWQKDLSWIVMTSPPPKNWEQMTQQEKNEILSLKNMIKYGIYRIPKPFGLGIIFGTVPERMVDHILFKNPRAFDGLLKTLQNGAAPGIIPTAAIPFIENWANKSFFTDRPIVPRSKEGLPAEYQYQPYTTETAKKLGEVLSRITGENSSMASPAKIENAIRGLSGGLGNHILKLADMALRKSGVLPDRIQPTKTLSDIPFIKAFVVRYPANDAESIQRFYDDYDKAKQTKAAAKELIKEGEGEKATALLSSRNISRLDNIGKALQTSHKLIDWIYYNQTMTSDEKRQLIDKTYLGMIAIAKSGNEIMDAAVNE